MFWVKKKNQKKNQFYNTKKNQFYNTKTNICLIIRSMNISAKPVRGLAISIPFHSTYPAPLVFTLHHRAHHVHAATCTHTPHNKHHTHQVN